MKQMRSFSLFWKIYLTLLLTLFLPMILFDMNHIAHTLRDRDDSDDRDDREPPGIFKNLEWNASELTERADSMPEELLASWIEDVKNSSGLEIRLKRDGKTFSTKGAEQSEMDEAQLRPGRPITVSARSRSGRTQAVVTLYLFSPSRRGFPDHVTIPILVALLCVIFSFMLVKNFMTPLSKLQNVTRKLADGDFSVRVDSSVTGRSDEIASLGRSFNRMAECVENLVSSQKRLLRDISHEIRSPLQRMNVAVALLKKDSQFCSGTGQYLDRIELEVGRIDSMVEELLTLVRAEEKALMSPELVVLDEVIRSIVKDAVFESAPDGKTVTANLSKLAVVGDALLLKRALGNVIRNAIHYTAPETGVEIDMRLEEKEDHVVIAIRDHGHGVAEGDLEKIFLPYYRTDEARERSHGGVGLGLSITKRIIESHGGKISAANSPKGGLEVIVRLNLLGI
jgi:two-component system sensor histidine kinase CpxA